MRMTSTRWFSTVSALVVGAVLLVACSQEVPVEPEASLSAATADRYIVVLHDRFAPGSAAANKARAAQIANEFGVGVRHAYGTALFGFSGTVPAGRLASLARDPRVAWVEPEEVHEISAQTVPRGIARIALDANTSVTTDGSGSVAVELDVAVLDTGISAHPDLSVAGGRNFANGGTSNWGDGNGHGTHVAGTIGALDNGFGVVGVAPGVRLWAVRVCGNSGFCMSGDIVAGIDWVAQQKVAGATDFVAANFSISSADSSNECSIPANATHKAICGLVEEGVVFVMSAGNDGRVKAPYPVALSVSALADFDGRPGGLFDGTGCRADEDDTLANFSNYGEKVDIAAPGVCILSTWNDGGYRTISGTSMAAPHVTGAVALYLHVNGFSDPRLDAQAITSAIIGAAHPQASACGYVDSRAGGPLLFVNGKDAFNGSDSCSAGGEGGGDGNGGDSGGSTPLAPIASFSYQCGNSATCTFTDTSSAGSSTIGSWAWEFQNAVPSTGTEPQVSTTFQLPGTHLVQLTVEDAKGATSKASSSISCSSHPRHGLRCK
jgi:subtilisin